MEEEVANVTARLDSLMAGKKLSHVNGLINRMSVEQLRSTCKATGMSSNGCRAVLEKRLKNRARRLHFSPHGKGVFDPTWVPVYFDCFVVLDFECTCWLQDNFYDADGKPRRVSSPHTQEIIEFPAVLVDCGTMTVTDEFHAYCRPVLHPKLTPYCVELTGVDQATVDAADTFPAVLEEFESWLRPRVSGRKFVVVTDGPTDLARFLYTQCEVSQVPFPKFANRWVNIKKIFANFFDVGRMKLPEMLDFLGMELEGRLHSGLDDAKNIARLLVQLIHEGALVFPNERLVPGSEADGNGKRASPRIESVKREDFLNARLKVRASAARSPMQRKPVIPRSDNQSGDENENSVSASKVAEDKCAEVQRDAKPGIVRSLGKNF